MISHALQAVKLAGQLAHYRCCQASPSAQPSGLHHSQTSSQPGLVVPIFAVSSVTGAGLPLLHAFLNALPSLPHAATPLVQGTSEHSVSAQQACCGGGTAAYNPHARVSHNGTVPVSCKSQAGAMPGLHTDDQTDSHTWYGRMTGTAVGSADRQSAATQFQVDHTFEVKGVGCVVSGTVVSGEVAVGQILNLGPTGQGLFREVQVTCIHRSQVLALLGLKTLCVCAYHAAECLMCGSLMQPN